MTIHDSGFHEEDARAIDLDETVLAKCVEEKDSKGIGKYFQDFLVKVLSDNSRANPAAFAVTDKSVYTYYIIGEKHDERRAQSRWAGRYFLGSAAEYDEKILYYGHSYIGLQNSEGSELPPNDDPYARQVIVTQVRDLVAAHECEDIMDLADIVNNTPEYLFLYETHEGLITNRIHDGSLVIDYEEYEQLPEEERDGKSPSHNALLAETFVALCNNLKCMRRAVKEIELRDAERKVDPDELW